MGPRSPLPLDGGSGSDRCRAGERYAGEGEAADGWVVTTPPGLGSNRYRPVSRPTTSTCSSGRVRMQVTKLGFDWFATSPGVA